MANTRVTTPVTDFDKATSLPGLKIPSGDNSDQPAGAAAVQGMIRNDTEEIVDSSDSAIAHYNGTAWQYFAATESPDVVYPTSLKMFLDASNTTSYPPPQTGATWFDLTSNANNGTISGAQWFDGYFDFDGSNDYVQVSPIPSTLQADAIITGGAWINPKSATANSIISFRGSSSPSIKFFLAANSSGQVYLVSSSTSTFLAFGTTSSNSVPVGQWTHVVATINYTSKTYTIYINKTLASSGSQSNIRAASTFGATNFFIGTNLIGVQHSNLKISKARLYNTALTQAEIDALVDEGR